MNFCKRSRREVREPDNYNKNLKMISLGVLFEGDIVLAKETKAMLDAANIDDWLLNFLCCRRWY